MKISIVAVMDQKRGIGKNNKIPWHIKEDLVHLKSLTGDRVVILGRKTYDSMVSYYNKTGRPMPGKLYIVVTRNLSLSFAGGGPAKLAGSLEEALRLASLAQGDDECFIIGGGQIYKEAIEKGLVDKLYLTIVDGNFDADAFFPDYSEFKKVISKEKHNNREYKFTFLELEK